MEMESLQEVKFPIISDRDIDFSKAFGVLKVNNAKFGAARALLILDTDGRMVHMTLHNKWAGSYPTKVLELIKTLNIGQFSDANEETASGDSSPPSSSINKSSINKSPKKDQDNAEKENHAPLEDTENTYKASGNKIMEEVEQEEKQKKTTGSSIRQYQNIWVMKLLHHIDTHLIEKWIKQIWA